MPTDLEQTTRHAVLLTNSQRSSDQNESFDTRGFDGQMLVIDVTSYTDGTTTFALQTSDDDTSPSAPNATLVSGDDAPTVDGGGKTGTYYVSYIGNERYVHVDTSTSGTTSGCTYAVYGVKSDPDKLPV